MSTTLGPLYIPVQRRNLLCSFVLINVTSLVIIYWNCYLYWYVEKGTKTYLITVSSLWFLTIVTFISTVFRDPGIITKQIDTDIDLSNKQARYAEDPINFTKNGLFRPVRMSNNFLYTSN